MIDEQSSASEHDYASDHSAIGATHLNRPTTRQLNLANYTRPRTKFTSLLPLHMFPKIWNELGTYYHNITQISRFKRIVRAHYINNYKKSIRCDNIRCIQCSQTH